MVPPGHSSHPGFCHLISTAISIINMRWPRMGLISVAIGADQMVEGVGPLLNGRACRLEMVYFLTEPIGEL